MKNSCCYLKCYFHNLFSDWTDELIYPEDADDIPNYSLEPGSTLNSTFSSSNSNIYVFDCFFTSITNQAIYLSSKGKVLIELSSFNNCTSSQHGGSICRKGGQCVIHKCCSIQCYTTGDATSNGYGQFLFTDLTSGSKNNILDCSVSLSYNPETELSGLNAPLCLQQGNVLIKIANISYNKCQNNAASVLIPTITTGISNSSFLNIVGNQATFSICYYGNNAKMHSLLYSNIIENNCSSQDEGMLFARNPLDVKHCYLVNNHAPIWFEAYSNDYYNGKITITNCTINEIDIEKKRGEVSIKSYQPKDTFYHNIKCTSDKEHCILFNSQYSIH